MWVFLACRSAGVKLGLQHLLALSAAENRFHLFSKIRACRAALRVVHTLFASLCTVQPHLPREILSRIPFVPAAGTPVPVPKPGI